MHTSRVAFLRLGVSGVALLLGIVSAHAQGTEVVTVTGEKYSVEKSIDQKRAATVVSDGISADEIGSIPEFGLGDALRKVPGLALQINNGRGEDQFLTVRGLNPDYNSIEIDGLQLVSTEETRRQVSLDVLPAVLVKQVSVNKTWSVDQVSDAIGGVTELHTRSAFDHPGEFFDSHADFAYWTNEAQVRGYQPSGQADVTYSRTFGDNNEFGFLILASYMRRSSSTLNSYTLGYSYYPYAGSGTVNTPSLRQTSATAASATLLPSDNVAGLIPVPDRHRWYFYDNDRTRPGLFGRLDWDDHHIFHAHLSGGIFEFINNENRYSQYLNRIGNDAINSPTTGSFAQGAPETDFDRFVQYRQLTYVDAGFGADFAPDLHADVTVNYGMGHYKQTTDEDQFTAPTSATYAFTYDLNAPHVPLFVPNNVAAFMNPANYSMVYHLDAIDRSDSHLPQVKAEVGNHADPDAQGLGWKAGWSWRELSQVYSYNQTRFNPSAPAPTLATTGVIPQAVNLYDGQGQTLLLVNPFGVRDYLNNNPSAFTRNASDSLSNTVNNYRLEERIQAFYAEASYRLGDLYALAGVRWENTNMLISNYQPVPFSSTTNFVNTLTPTHYAKLLPSLNLMYDVSEEIKLRGAISQNLGRPTYSALAQNGTASLNAASFTASETISNPNLKPRKSTNYDLSAEYYPTPGVLASVAVFDKEIEDEIVTLSTTVPNSTVPGFGSPVTLTISQAQNTDKASVQGVELGLSDVKFDFLPDFFSDFGGIINASFVSMDTPHIRMTDGTLRRLPQLMESSKFVGNVALLYSRDAFSGEIAYNYTSKMPIAFDANNAVNDQWWAGISTLDAQVSYKLNDNIFFRIQGKNLTDARPQKVVGATQQLNYSTLDNGSAYWFGVGASF